jgi:hypothetical protein
VHGYSCNVDLRQSEICFSRALNKKVETVGYKNIDLQVTRFVANRQPNYFFEDGNGKKLLPRDMVPSGNKNIYGCVVNSQRKR